MNKRNIARTIKRIDNEIKKAENEIAVCDKRAQLAKIKIDFKRAEREYNIKLLRVDGGSTDIPEEGIDNGSRPD
jgi:hypothetical protein